jgi:hypothetical protein
MKKKSCLKYFFIITLIIIVVFLGDYVFDSIKEFQMTFSFFLYLFLEMGIYVIIGLLLGVEHLIQEFKKVGVWRINLIKLALLGIPSLYFALGIFIYFGIGRHLPNILIHPIGLLIKNSTNYLHVFQLILGHSIITSFYKKCGEYESR